MAIGPTGMLLQNPMCFLLRGTGRALMKLLGSFNAWRYPRVYDDHRLGKRGALSTVHLNYLFQESLEGFEVVAWLICLRHMCLDRTS
jgi:hypothetical protein